MISNKRPILFIDSNRTTYQVQWGFFLENTLFRAFEPHNNHIIEQAHQELAHRVGNNYVDIVDQVLGSSARVYFGVERIHLRMPGTRYYVERRLTAINSPSARTHSWAPTTIRRSTVRQPRPSTSAPATLATQQTRRTISRRSSRVLASTANVVRPPAKLSTRPTPSASTKTTKSITGNSSSSTTTTTTTTSTNTLSAATGESFPMMPSTSASTLSFGSHSTLAQATSVNGPESFDWDTITPRLAHKASQEWSQTSSSSSSSSTTSTTFPLSPLASPDFKRRKQNSTAKSATSGPTPEHTAVHNYTQERQQQSIPIFMCPSEHYSLGGTFPIDPVNVPSSSVGAPHQAGSVDTSSNVSINNIDYQMVDALNAMSISLPSQGIPQQANQDLFLMTPPMKESSMAIDQLSASDISSYWVWPAMTTNIQPTIAAGTANIQAGTNNLQFFDDESDLVWYTNGGGSIGFTFHH